MSNLTKIYFLVQKIALKQVIAMINLREFDQKNVIQGRIKEKKLKRLLLSIIVTPMFSPQIFTELGKSTLL